MSAPTDSATAPPPARMAHTPDPPPTAPAADEALAAPRRGFLAAGWAKFSDNIVPGVVVAVMAGLVLFFFNEVSDQITETNDRITRLDTEHDARFIRLEENQQEMAVTLAALIAEFSAFPGGRRRPVHRRRGQAHQAGGESAGDGRDAGEAGGTLRGSLRGAGHRFGLARGRVRELPKHCSRGSAMATADQFTYSAVWSESDQEWVGLCDGFDEAMNWMAPDRQAALDGIQTVVGEFLELLDEQGLPHPTPTGA